METSIGQDRGNRDRAASELQDDREVGVVDRFGDEHFIAGIEHGPQSGVQSQCRTTCHQDFVTGGILGPAVSQDRSGNSIPEPLLTPVVRVAGATLGQCLLRRTDDMFGRGEIRCAAHQRNERPPLALQLADFLEN